MKSLVEIRVDPPSGTIILDRPGHANAITRYGLEQLKQALEDLHQQQSVRAVIVIGVGKVPHLLDQQPCAGWASLETDDPPGQVRGEPPNADELVDMVVQAVKRHQDSPLLGHPNQIVGEQFLKLVRFDAEGRNVR